MKIKSIFHFFMEFHKSYDRMKQRKDRKEEQE